MRRMLIMLGALLLAEIRVVESCRIIAYAGDEEVNARKLLLDSENSLPKLAYDHPFLPALKTSKYWNEEQCAMRNAHENKDGWGLGWFDDHSGMGYPLRYRTNTSLVDEANATSPVFMSLLDGSTEISRAGVVREASGAFTHVQGLLSDIAPTSDATSSEVFPGEVVASCGVEAKQTTNAAIESRVIFGHVRKATSKVTPENAHPFVFGRLLWMHNGALPDFDAYRAVLLKKLRPNVRGLLQGDVDSEHAGALFCNHLEGFPSRETPYSMVELRGAMRMVVSELRAMSAEAALNNCQGQGQGVPPPASLPALGNNSATEAEAAIAWAPASMNFAVSDGRGLVMTRFRSSKDQDPPSLYYKLGISHLYKPEPTSTAEGGGGGGGDLKERRSNKNADGLIVASEPLEETMPALSAWRLLGKDKMISYSPDEGVRVECMSERCTPDLPADHGVLYGGV
eukprot:CAMPEP_0171921350 /NCGR_PEP_ID=MMETSP0993-20121228/20162_1 /TAXON_ID=483369 /ORGANISM="non described non described, Strain CCMP2098" /LENGTH=454 /DNA_ID=CAMNT_0012558707 /DNA_START=24 /DNA_END=1388 /DNA_ORIENTATION=+